jgi:hypothetical protein
MHLSKVTGRDTTNYRSKGGTARRGQIPISLIGSWVRLNAFPLTQGDVGLFVFQWNAAIVPVRVAKPQFSRIENSLYVLI